MKEIPLTQGLVAKVCDCHYHLVKDYKWHASQNKRGAPFYAKRNRSLPEILRGKSAFIRMHSLINNTPEGLFTDHINNDTLDNRCCNLRTATANDNVRNKSKCKNNTSGYKGVFWHKRDKKWISSIGVNGEQIQIGRFDTAEDAARAYDETALKYHGEFANLNFK